MFWKRTPKKELVSRLIELTEAGAVKWTSEACGFCLDLDNGIRISLIDSFSFKGYISLKRDPSTHFFDSLHWTSFAVGRLIGLVSRLEKHSEALRNQELVRDALEDLGPGKA